MRAERAFLDPDGLPGRPWYRHTIFAPKYSYAPEVLPAVAEAIRTGDPGRVRAALVRLTLAILRAADALDGRALSMTLEALSYQPAAVSSCPATHCVLLQPPDRRPV